MKNKPNRRRISAIILILAFAGINIFSNIYLRAKILVVTKINVFYEKLSAAYDIGGAEGLKKEYALILSRKDNQGKYVQKFLRNIGERINKSENPEVYISSVIKKEKNDIRNTRIAVLVFSCLIFIFLFLRLWLRSKF